MTVSNIQKITQKEQLAKILKENPNQNVIVDFFAEWCPPCKALKPHLETFAKNHCNTLILLCNVDEAPDIASTFGVRSIPTLFLIRNGKEIEKHMGAFSNAAEIEAWVKKAIQSSVSTPLSGSQGTCGNDHSHSGRCGHNHPHVKPLDHSHSSKCGHAPHEGCQSSKKKT